jgi:hypothetical protein
MVKVFVSVHVIKAGILVDFDSVDQSGVDLRTEDLLVMLASLEDDSACFFFIIHLISSIL